MKAFGVAVLLLFVVASSQGASSTGWNDKGILTAGDVHFRLFHHDLSWKNARIWNGGEFLVFGGAFQVSVHTGEDGGVSCAVDARDPVETKFLALQTSLPIERKIRIDGKAFSFGATLHKKQWMRNFNAVGKLEIPSENGIVVIQGKFPVQLVDERMFGRSTLGIRLPLSPQDGALRQARWHGSISWSPVQSTMLDLRSAATFGFRDRIAWDGKGGWTDQGAMNDMSSLPVGKVLAVKGLTFDIINPDSNGGRGCIALKCPKVPHLPVRSSVDYSNNPP